MELDVPSWATQMSGSLPPSISSVELPSSTMFAQFEALVTSPRNKPKRDPLCLLQGHHFNGDSLQGDYKQNCHILAFWKVLWVRSNGCFQLVQKKIPFGGERCPSERDILVLCLALCSLQFCLAFCSSTALALLLSFSYKWQFGIGRQIRTMTQCVVGDFANTALLRIHLWVSMRDLIVKLCCTANRFCFAGNRLPLKLKSLL